MKPIIGIVAKPGYDNPMDIWKRMDIVDELRFLIVQNGGIAITILPTENTMKFNDNDTNEDKNLTKGEIKDLYQIIDKCDGIILQGGLVSCKYEIEVAKRALELDIPLIGICAGFNNILRAIGSDVEYDESQKHNHYDIDYRHEVKICKDTLLYELVNKENIEVNSIHSMIAKRESVEPFAKISAVSKDGLVECFELPLKSFVMGIKWHPELMINDKSTKAIFSKFVEECKRNI